MLVALVIGNTAYTSTGVALAGFSGAGGTLAWGKTIREVRLTLDDENYSSVEFNAMGCGPAIPFKPGLPIQLTTANDNGTSPVTRFTGDLQRPQQRGSNFGPSWGYSATDLKRRADYVTLLSTAGLSPASYNLEPGDPYYLFNLAGLSVGNIIKDVLTAIPNASALAAYGVGNFTFSGGVYTLPSQTLADLALLFHVPGRPIHLSGEGILNRLEGLMIDYHPQFTCWVEPTGTIRFASIFGRTAQTFTLPAPGAAFQPIDSLAYDVNTDSCYTAVNITGQDVFGFVASTRDGTLTRATTPTQLTNWRLKNYSTGDNSDDDGTMSSVTSSSATVTSAHASAFWSANFWNQNGGQIVMRNDLVSGIATTETRQITSCTALSPGGSATITWDSSLPIDSTGYTKYRMYATNSPLNLVDRAFYVTEPATGATGLATFVGSHMVAKFSQPFPWGNFGKGAQSVELISWPAAQVVWSATGDTYAAFRLPDGVDLDPQTGRVILKIPAVVIAAGLAGTTNALNSGYPTTYAQGKPADVVVAIPYSRGDINARAPASGFSGTAYAQYGIERVKTIPLNSFRFRGDKASLALLANEYLLTMRDAVVHGSIRLHYDSWTPTFDPLTLGYAITLVTPTTSELTGLNLPVRTVSVEWPDAGADIMLVTFEFNNQHRAFEGDDLYLHPSFSPQNWGEEYGETFDGSMYSTPVTPMLMDGSGGGHEGPDSINTGKVGGSRADKQQSEATRKAMAKRQAETREVGKSADLRAAMEKREAEDARKTRTTTDSDGPDTAKEKQVAMNRRAHDRDLNRTGPPARYAHAEPKPPEEGPFNAATRPGEGIGGLDETEPENGGI